MSRWCPSHDWPSTAGRLCRVWEWSSHLSGADAEDASVNKNNHLKKQNKRFINSLKLFAVSPTYPSIKSALTKGFCRAKYYCSLFIKYQTSNDFQQLALFRWKGTTLVSVHIIATSRSACWCVQYVTCISQSQPYITVFKSELHSDIFEG